MSPLLLLALLLLPVLLLLLLLLLLCVCALIASDQDFGPWSVCVCGLGCVPRRTVPRRTAQTRLSQPACRLLARCRAGAAAAGVARVRALLQGHAPVVGLPRRLGKSS